MPKFYKKPVVVDAVQFTWRMAMGLDPLPEGVIFVRRSCHPSNSILYSHSHVIKTLEGTMDVKIGSWIITGVKGEKYPCDDEVFGLTYEPVTESAAKEAYSFVGAR